MKQNKLFLGLATMFAAAFAFTSCSSDDAESQTQKVDQNRTIRLVSTLEKGGTRSTSDPQAGTSLSTSSNLAIWAINQTGPAALTNGNNEQYTVDGDGNLSPKTAANTMNWPNEATLNFYAYAPYNSGYSYNEANNFSVQTDQSTEDNYLASDLVLAQATGKTYNAQTPVELSFKHLMSKINITIQKADGAQVDLSKAKVTITNTKIATTFTPNAEESSILAAASGDATNILAVSALGAANTACAIIVPQEIAAGTALVKIETTSEATSGANRTLIAKLSTATTFASGQSYNFTVTVNDQTTPSIEPEVVELQFGSASLVEWGDNNLGAVTEEPYTIGDYVLNDGTFLRQSQLASATDEVKAKISAVIFSTTSHDTGWDGYAVSVCGKKASQIWQSGENITASILGGGSAITEIGDAVADYTGLTVTTAAKAANYTSAFAFTNYMGGGNGKNIQTAVTNSILSGWFMPSVGQMIELFENLGGGSFSWDNITWTGQGEINDIKPTGRTTIISSINSHKVGNTDIIEAADYVTTTQSAEDKMWMIKLSGSEETWTISKSASKTGTNRNVLPIVAFKFPTE